jgi:hypothetical protein
MKTVKITSLALIFLIAGIAKSIAGENETYNRAVSQLTEELSLMFKQFPFEAINGDDNSCRMTLTFTVNDQHQMENIRVESEDKGLAQYVQSVIERRNLKLDPALDGISYIIPLRFVAER